MKTATRTPRKFKDFPTKYVDLVAMLPPRVINDRVDLAAVEAVVFEMAGHKLTPDQDDYLDTLSTLVEDYQERTEPEQPDEPLHKRLRFLIDHAGMTQAEFAKLAGVSQPHASMILSGKRDLGKETILRLSAHFRVAAEYFM